MSPPRQVHPLATIAFGLWLLAGQAYADLLTAADSSGLQVSLRNQEFRGNDWQVQRVYLTVGTNQLAFLVPQGFRADASNPQRIVMSAFDSSCFITFRFMDPELAGGKELQSDCCRALALSRFSGARITNEHGEYACNHSGLGFDLQWTLSGGAEQSARVVFIPSAAGIMEFSVLSSSARFEDSQTVLRTVLASLRSNELGPLRIIPVADRS